MAEKEVFDGRERARQLPTRPGVYLLKDEDGTTLYVGKARNLRKRVASYFDARPKIERTMRMVARVRDMDVNVTRTEGEALLLENELIKLHQPRYNVLLKDDKSYPWIEINSDHPYPRIGFHRGGRHPKRTYYGPYPSASSVRESLNLIQKLFMVRNCEDSYFAHRRRPCLQYQIRRCTAPCVDRVSEADYAAQVEDAMLFLEGRNQRVIERLIQRMESAAEDQRYEEAARYRDQIATLKQMQSQQFVSGSGGDIDVIAVATERGRACVQVVAFRGGRNLGHRSYFPTQSDGLDAATVLQGFLGQYYRDRVPPPHLLLSHPVEDQELFESVFSERAGRRVRLQSQPRGERRQWLELARTNARQSLELRLARQAGLETQFEDLQALLELDAVPRLIECFDISHTAGNETVGSCVAFDPEGPVKSRYRRFNLKGITPGDDYAAMAQVLRRHYQRVGESGELPDLVLIDGGAGQLSVAVDVLAECGLDGLPLMSVAKGRARRAGDEDWLLPVAPHRLHPGPESPASHLVQQIRDEAHRFAITGHRGRRQKASVKSSLEEIPGIGAARRRALLAHFGGMQGVRKAGVEELSSVPGINQTLAEAIYRALH